MQLSSQSQMRMQSYFNKLYLNKTILLPDNRNLTLKQKIEGEYGVLKRKRKKKRFWNRKDAKGINKDGNTVKGIQPSSLMFFSVTTWDETLYRRSILFCLPEKLRFSYSTITFPE